MKVYLGLVGCYRTFEKTSENLFSDLIYNNPTCTFDIHINTETIPKYVHKKWGDENSDVFCKNWRTEKYYTEDELNILFKKHYKSHLKKITYYTHEKGSPFYERIKTLINEHNDNEKYDLYFFMRIDCILSKKLDLYNYANKLDKNMVKLICRGDNVQWAGGGKDERFDHNRDWDMGIISKNIDNIHKFVTYNYNTLTPDNNELKKMAKVIKCNNIFTKYDLPLPSKIEKQYKSSWMYMHNCDIYSFNKQIAPLWYEDEFFLCILR